MAAAASAVSVSAAEDVKNDFASGEYNYIVTAQKPTIVTHSVTGNFTGPDKLNLILGKSTRLEIHEMSPDGLEALMDIPIYGRISGLKIFRPAGEQQDLLFIQTEKNKFCVLAFNADTGEITTRANGDTTHTIGRPSDAQISIIDPECRLVGLHVYDGNFQAIPFKGSKLHQEAFNIRLQELQVIDMCFLHDVGSKASAASSSAATTSMACLAVLYADPRGARHLKTYMVNLADRLLEEGTWSVSNLEAAAQTLIPVEAPFGGAIVVGQHSVSYFMPNSAAAELAVTTELPQETALTCFGRVDKQRVLLGDLAGNVAMLVLKHDNTKVVALHVEPLGYSSIPSTISYLDNAHVFIGSAHGDSALIKLTPERDQTGSCLSVVETYPNLGPIVDMAVVDLDRQGQGQVVTCSGGYDQGSLRVVRNGIAINENASVEMEGIKGIWSLADAGSGFHKYLVETFVSETRMLAMEDEELQEITMPGFDHKVQTLYCGNTASSCFVQATAASVRLVSCESKELLSEWKPSGAARITVVHANSSTVLLSSGGGRLVLLDVQGNEVKQISETTLEHEVACVDVSAVSPVAAVGTWTDVGVRLLALPSLKEICREKFDGDILPRSLKFARMQDCDFLLCGLGDGHLYSFVVSSGADSVELTQKRRIALGTQPVILREFERDLSSADANDDEELKDADRGSRKVTHVFASCDRPTVIYGNERSPGKLLYSNVNFQQVTFMAPFNSEIFSNCLAFATDEELVIGDIDDEIQKLHVSTVELNAQPRRIAYQAESGSFLVSVSTLDESADAGADADADADADAAAPDQTGLDTNVLRLLDSLSFDVQDSFKLQPYEECCSLISVPLQAQAQNSGALAAEVKADHAASPVQHCYVVGTAFVLPNERDPSRGRLLVFRADAGKLTLLAEETVRGAVYTMCAFNGGILAGVNSSIHMYQLSASGDSSSSSEAKSACSLVKHASFRGHILVLYIKARGDFILVGDLMKSMNVLAYQTTTGLIVEVAKDYNSNWMTAIHMMDGNFYMGAESSYNLFTLRRNTDAEQEEERARLDTVGAFHLGDFVNVFQPGSLVMALPDPDAVNPQILAGTISGSIIAIAPLTKAQFSFFSKVEQALENVVKGIGGFSHQDWRSFSSERKTVPCSNFVDGDLVETALELDEEKLGRVAAEVGVQPAELLKRIEIIARIH